jgi:D-hexose-6-phosphate mutarotase
MELQTYYQVVDADGVSVDGLVYTDYNTALIAASCHPDHKVEEIKLEKCHLCKCPKYDGCTWCK